MDLIYIDPPFNSNRNYEVFWGETKEKRSFDDRHESTQAYIDFMRPRCVELARVLKKTGSFYYHCDWHASHYVKVMLDQIFGENNFVNEIIWKRQSHIMTQSKARNILAVCMTRFSSIQRRRVITSSNAPVHALTTGVYVETSTSMSNAGDGTAGISSAILQAPGGEAPSKGNPAL